MKESQKQDLLQLAASAARHAHAPYSQYRVGAAVLAGSGKLFAGCNVENASYGLTLCAERTAVVKAISEGESSLRAIALVTSDGGTPCGACRQVLAEFSDATMMVLVQDASTQAVVEYTLGQLLPHRFGGS